MDTSWRMKSGLTQGQRQRLSAGANSTSQALPQAGSSGVARLGGVWWPLAPQAGQAQKLFCGRPGQRRAHDVAGLAHFRWQPRGRNSRGVDMARRSLQRLAESQCPLGVTRPARGPPSRWVPMHLSSPRQALLCAIVCIRRDQSVSQMCCEPNLQVCTHTHVRVDVCNLHMQLIRPGTVHVVAINIERDARVRLT